MSQQKTTFSTPKETEAKEKLYRTFATCHVFHNLSPCATGQFLLLFRGTALQGWIPEINKNESPLYSLYLQFSVANYVGVKDLSGPKGNVHRPGMPRYPQALLS